VFEGATADAHETTLGTVDPTGDRTINLPNQSGTLPVLSAASATAITATPEEINLIDGGTARGTTTVASGDGILINDGGTMRMTNVDTVSTYFASHNVGGGNIVTTGALDSGTITSGFGNINTGSSTIDCGTVTAAALAVDNITIDGTEIDLSSGDLTLDVAGDIVLDADGGDVKISDAGTHVGSLSNSSSDFVMESIVSDKDIIFKGNDGGSGITALTLDMSGAGAATFNNDVTAFSDERLKTDIKTIEDALEKVSQMRGVTFKREGVNGTGVIAQEVQPHLPEVVHDKQEYLSVAYGNMVGILIEAIKELKTKVDKLGG